MSGGGEQPDDLPSTGTKAMYALRAQRKRNRLGDLEWFDAAYRVYVVGLFGGIVLAWLSDRVGDEPLSAAQAADVLQHGPALLGMAAVIAVFASGAGRYLSLESLQRNEALLRGFVTDNLALSLLNPSDDAAEATIGAGSFGLKGASRTSLAGDVLEDLGAGSAVTVSVAPRAWTRVLLRG